MHYPEITFLIIVLHVPGAKKLLFTVSPTFIATCQGKFTHYTY